MASDDGRETGERRRRERLAASLRENLKRRKAQQRGRTVGGAEASPPKNVEAASEPMTQRGEPRA